MPSTQERIKEYMSSRNLSENVAEWLTGQAVDAQPGGCVRCGSSRIQREETEKWNTGRNEAIGSLGTGGTPTGFREECIVCGQVLEDPNGETIADPTIAPTLLEVIFGFLRR